MHIGQRSEYLRSRTLTKATTTHTCIECESSIPTGSHYFLLKWYSGIFDAQPRDVALCIGCDQDWEAFIHLTHPVVRNFGTIEHEIATAVRERKIGRSDNLVLKYCPELRESSGSNTQQFHLSFA